MISKKTFCSLCAITAISLALFVGCKPTAENNKQLVRLALVEVDTSQVDSYNEFLREEIEASIQKEPGVITLFGVAERENPERITLFETYGDSARYKAHLATPHFQKYKQGTLHMVTHLELVETKPILYHRKTELSQARSSDLLIRLIKMEIDSSQIENFVNLATDVMSPAIKNEPGILVMYAVAKKLKPTDVTILEVYKNEKAYEAHRQTPHFIEYNEKSKDMVRSLKIIDVKPILLGSKVQ